MERVNFKIFDENSSSIEAIMNFGCTKYYRTLP